MKDILAFIRLLLEVGSIENGTLVLRVDLQMSGLVNVLDPDGNWIVFVDRPVEETTDPAA